MRMRCALCGMLMAVATTSAWSDETPRVTVEHGPTGKPYLSYGGEPLFAFGPGDESRITGGAADLERWAAWQRDNGMNLLRTYPCSIPLAVYGTPGPEAFHRAGDGSKWDVDRFDDAFFASFGDAVRRLEEHGILVHLQLWQIVFFKSGPTRWDANYLNPRNNINEWTREFERGHQYINAPAGSRARAHQRAWVTHILDAVKGRGNVWIDVINELGNEMGDLEWAVEVVGWIREWERENDWHFLVGVDSEHHYRPDQFGRYADHFDLIILNEPRSPEHAREAFDAFGKPIVSVRSSDGSNRREDYMFADENQTGPEHQTRYRTLCYRSMFSNLQAVGAYWKSPVDVADYKDMAHWPRYARALRAFWKMIAPEWPGLVVDDGIVKSDPVAPHAYGLRSDALHLVYLECGSHTWNEAYPASEIVIAKPATVGRVALFHPRTGETDSAEYAVRDDAVVVSLPAFTEDIVVMAWAE